MRAGGSGAPGGGPPRWLCPVARHDLRNQYRSIGIRVTYQTAHDTFLVHEAAHPRLTHIPFCGT